MKQIFHPSMNFVAKASIIVGGLSVLALAGAFYFLIRSSYFTGVDITVQQPVPFSHLHHVDQLGIDCQYCHTSVENAAYAGVPPTETCMTCHSQVWTEAEILAPVRASWDTGQPIAWNKVHDLSDFVYFNHSIHINNGIGCETCHGRVDRMHLPYKNETMFMSWCLDCHRNPAQFVRPLDEIYTMGWTPPADFDAHALVEAYNIEVGRLDDCSICHR